MQTVSCRSAAGSAPAQTVVPTIAAITVTPVIFIASPSYADAGGGEREKRPWPWYFLLEDCDRAGPIRGSHWLIEGLERYLKLSLPRELPEGNELAFRILSL